MPEHEAIEGVPADVDLGPCDLRREELPEVVLVVHAVPDERDAAPQLRLLRPDPSSPYVEPDTVLRRGLTPRGEDRVGVQEQDLAGHVRLGHRAG